jgi:hypothetical protein
MFLTNLIFGQKKNNFENFPAIGGLMVSKMVADEGKKPLFMYREKPTNEQDSGWRIFSGFESEEYNANPKNIGIYNPSTILKIDSSISDLLLKPRGYVFERKSKKSKWYNVTDFPLDDDFIVINKLTNEWNIEINNLFTREEERNGDLVYVTEDKTLRIAIWNDKQEKEKLFEQEKSRIENRKPNEPIILEKFDFSDSEISRIGYMVSESDGIKSYKVLYGFSIIDKQVVQVAIYFDDDNDKNWAIETWKSIKLNK